MAVQDSTQRATKLPRFYGLSTDEKPPGTMVGGATFLETDTQKGFVWTGSEWVRDERVTVEQTGPITITGLQSTDALLTDILTELRINNMHQAVITGDVLTEEDVEDDSN